MCNLVGESRCVEAPILNRGGIIGYKVVLVPKTLNKMTAPYAHWERKRREYKFNKLVVATISKHDPRRIYPVASKMSKTGFYVFNTYREALKQRRCNDYMEGWSIARVRCFGRAVFYTNGFRCQKMIVESIVCGRRPKVK